MGRGWDVVTSSLHPEVRAAVHSLKFPTMTPVQAATIPQILAKKDVAAEAVTGSGKTLAFLVPLLEILKRREAAEEKWKKHQIGALVISPTRELAQQIADVLQQLLEHVTDLTKIVFVGGNSVDKDVERFKSEGGNVVVCTPGRLEDLLVRRSDLNLRMAVKSLEMLVLDEADRLLDMGFRASIDTILGYLPRQRRTGLFSATQTKQVEDLIRAGLRNPVMVSVSAKAPQSTPEQLTNYYIITQDNGKLATLLSFLKERKIEKSLLFLPTCACVDYWYKVLPHLLKNTGMSVMAIHGKMKDKRYKVIDAFKKADSAILLCTDVLARGIDIPEVDWVFQWDPPANASAFVHRVGRTARQGRQGSALLLLLKNEDSYVYFIERNQRVQLNRLEDPATAATAGSALSTQLTDKLRSVQKKDRAVMEMATRAFVSHVRAYTKHECSMLLKVKEWPLGGVAACYGLLQLPKMPELKGRDLSLFPALADFDPNSVPYKDKAREAARLKKLEQYKNTGQWPGFKGSVGKKPTVPWSEAAQKKGDRKEKRMKRKRAKQTKMESGEAPVKKKRKKGISQEDLDDLIKDVALLKKLKKKKISDEDFDKAFGIE